MSSIIGIQNAVTDFASARHFSCLPTTKWPTKHGGILELTLQAEGSAIAGRTVRTTTGRLAETPAPAWWLR
jgi:hypothetical protein